MLLLLWLDFFSRCVFLVLLRVFVVLEGGSEKVERLEVIMLSYFFYLFGRLVVKLGDFV